MATDAHLAANIRRVELPGDRSLVVRPVTPGDVAGVEALYDGLDDEARYRRFFSNFRPDHAFYERVTTVAAHGGFGLVAVLEAGNAGDTIVGEAGYFTRASGGEPELAITVAQPWRGWLGAYLLDTLLAAAADRGIPNLRAEVLVANGPMVALLRTRGYATVEHSDWSIMSVLIGTRGRTPCWEGRNAHPRVLVEVPGGRWQGEEEARARGIDVLVCPGPRDYPARCPALEGEVCPLAAQADAIVVRPIAGDPRWEALIEAHARLHPDIPIAVELPGRTGGSGLVALAPVLAAAQDSDAAADTRADT